MPASASRLGDLGGEHDLALVHGAQHEARAGVVLREERGRAALGGVGAVGHGAPRPVDQAQALGLQRLAVAQRLGGGPDLRQRHHLRAGGAGLGELGVLGRDRPLDEPDGDAGEREPQDEDEDERTSHG